MHGHVHEHRSSLHSHSHDVSSTVGITAFPHQEGATLCDGIPHVSLPDGRSMHVFQATHLYDAIVPSATRPPPPPLSLTDLHPFASAVMQPVCPPPQVPPVQDVVVQLEHAIATALMQPQPPPASMPPMMADMTDSTLE